MDPRRGANLEDQSSRDRLTKRHFAGLPWTAARNGELTRKAVQPLCHVITRKRLGLIKIDKIDGVRCVRVETEDPLFSLFHGPMRFESMLC